MTDTLPAVQNGNPNGMAVMQETAALAMEQVVMYGDLSKLNAQQRLAYYNSVCQSIGLNPLTRPFDYITLNSKLTLYAKRDAADQLRKINKIVLGKPEIVFESGLILVTIQATDQTGRTDYEIGAVAIENLKGEARANAIMKAITKAKRRVTLSLCGLGWLDETEVESIPNAQPVAVDFETGEVLSQSPALPATATTQQRRPAPPPEPVPDVPITDATMWKLHAAGKDCGFSPEALHDVALWEFNAASKKDMTDAQGQWLAGVLKSRGGYVMQIKEIAEGAGLDLPAVLRVAKVGMLAMLSIDLLVALRDHLDRLPKTGKVRETLMGKLHFAADARGVSESDLVNLAGTRYSAESLDELTDAQIGDFESHIRGNYEPVTKGGAE